MKIKNNVIFSIITTLLWVFFILWNRFIRERLPRSIVSQNTLDLRLLIIISLFIISFFVFSYYLLTYLKIIPRPKSKFAIIKNKIITYLTRQYWFLNIDFFVSQHIIDGPKNVYNIIYKYLYVKPFLDHIGAKLSYYFQEKPTTIYIIIFIMPKTVPWIILFFELTLTHNINYFYKSLLLFLIPLICNILLYMIEHHSTSSIDYYKPYFIFRYIDERVHVYFINLVDPSPEELIEQERLSARAGDIWFFYQNIYSICYKITEKKESYKYLLNIFLYALISLDFLIHLFLLIGIYPFDKFI